MRINIFLGFIFLSLFVPLEFHSQNKIIDKGYSSGLIFKSHEVNKDDRTCLDLLPEKPLRIPKGYSLEFDLKLVNTFHTYGYIFRMVINDTTSLDMTSYMSIGRINVILNGIHETKATSEYKYEREQLDGKWIKVKVQIEKTKITYLIDGKQTDINTSGDLFESGSIDKIYFGANRHKYFYTSDVPPMALKNVIIRNGRGEIVREWAMAKHGDNEVYDNVKGARASVVNGMWEIDKHVNWTKEISVTTNRHNPQIATDSVNARVFVAVNDSIYIMHLRDKYIERIKAEEGSPFIGASSYLIYDYKKDQLISYNINQEELLIYDFTTNRWSGKPSNNSLYIQHHNRFINPDSNQLVIFGGYGLYKYNAILATYNLYEGQWKTKDLINDISPRYLSSMAYQGDGKMLVFGGYGSKTGIQETSSYNIYDLQLIDTRNNTSQKVGQLADMPKPHTFGNSMIINLKENKLYTLANRSDVYKSSIRLCEVDMNDFSYRLLTDSIPYNFQDTESYSDLFLYKGTSLYSVICQRIDGKYDISVYSLLYPPLSQADVLQVGVNTQTTYSRLLVYIISGLLLVSILLALYLVKKKRKDKVGTYVSNTESSMKPEGILQKDLISKEKKYSTILFFGGFQIFDRKGDDITGLFTPVIRQMFLLCLLEYVATGKGITSERLDEEFWYDMDKNKATNNRNVNIRKLRLILQEIGDVTFQKDNSYWHVVIGNDTFCDYLELMRLLNAMAETTINKSDVENVVNLASSGVLLPNIDRKWVDKYKSDYSNLLVDILMSATKIAEVKNDLKLMLRLADVILTHDSIDEDSIRIKCYSLYKLGQKGLSKQCYNKFCVDYKSILNEEPKLKYESIISDEIN
ncbi:hypothetical protein JGH11_16525 [Dysgonomonas sp. Marseille-P4677]|uniref:hypothetical protein n=1 Tax=Dysgonomonas sp. Marseille-P4677 TaxID=2364790 RepID=UPI001911B229|nr:hypothetical protein [Dysgonomonas sp. Marseille-P4677]MBK5722480.1 hypothetical protein [Dysgonomonas sp. Marseille-P4677]